MMIILYIMQNISVADARQHLSEILGQVAYGGEAFLITKKGRPMARLVPVIQPKPSRKKTSPRGENKVWLEDDDPFWAHIERIRGEQRTQKPASPFSFNRSKK